MGLNHPEQIKYYYHDDILGRYYIPSNSSHFPYLKSMQSDVTEWMAINPRNSKEMKFAVIILMFKIKM